MNSPAVQPPSNPSDLPRRHCWPQCWESIEIQHFQHPAGECRCPESEQLTLSLSLSPRPVQMMQRQASKTYTGIYQKGDITITPARTPFFARWQSDDNFLQIRLANQLIQSVAAETLEQDPARIELLPEWQVRSPQIEAIGIMLLTELQQSASANRLYIDSLANVLAIHLLRHHATKTPRLKIYEGGLPQRQLIQVLDYIDAHLDRDIKLADLSQLLDTSQFHFSRLFKQSVGLSPYQYLMQQRIERAKQLLKHTDRLIMEIALDCGFNSHSQLSKQFRQLTGTTPKAYRKG